MVTKFEEDIGFEFDRKLRLAICAHKSHVHQSLALKKYGNNQEALALFGDRLIKDIGKMYEDKEVYMVLPTNMLYSNKFMYHYIWDMGWHKHLKIKATYSAKKKEEHEYGTFFEAIVAGIHLQHNFLAAHDFVINYFREMTSLVHIFGGTDFKYNVICLDIPGTHYHYLKSLMLVLFNSHVKIRESTKSRYGVELQISIPKPNCDQADTRSYYESRGNYEKSIETAASKAIAAIDNEYIVKYEKAIE